MKKNVLEFLEASSQQFPEKLAVVDEKEGITYRELRKKAIAIANKVIENKIMHAPIVVIVDSSVSSIVSFWGVLYSGNFYVPIDKETPEERINTYIDTIEPAAVISTVLNNKSIREMCIERNVPYYEISEICLHIENENVQTEEPDINITQEDTTYLVFTSGSTGRPKAIQKSHRSVCSFIQTFIDVFGFSEDNNFAEVASLEFDVAAKSIFVACATGATLTMMPQSIFKTPSKVIEFLIDNHITAMIWPTSAVAYLANYDALSYKIPSDIRYIMFSGDVLPPKCALYMKTYIPYATIVNLYAPSEVTGNCLYFEITDAWKDTAQIPLGQPFPTMEVTLHAEDGSIITEDGLGEIYVKGPFLSSGYYKDWKRTDAVFKKDEDGNLIYQTGDIAERKGENLYFRGRRDFQVKVRGHRVELEEIEMATNSLKDIKCSCCIYDKIKDKLILFVEAKSENRKYLRDMLSQRLPVYAIPKKIIYMDQIPINSHGKCDRKKLMEII